ANMAGESAEDPQNGYRTPGYRRYVLNVLLLIFILNFMDRTLLAVVAPQMKPELGISDTQFGLLTGFGFAEALAITHRHQNIRVTVLCPQAVDTPLLKGATGTQSLDGIISPEEVAESALEAIAQETFLALPHPQVLTYMRRKTDDYDRWIAGMARLLNRTVEEPPRGYSDPKGTTRREKVRFSDGLREIMSKRSFWSMTAAATIAAFCGYAVSSFQSLFVNRTFGLTAGEAALSIHVPVAIASSLGAAGTGWLATRLASRSITAIAWLPGIGMIVCVPFY
ncbi:MAG: hypothetical protein ACK58T_44090, partial [Phycisphaerae bacterium]